MYRGTRAPARRRRINIQSATGRRRHRHEWKQRGDGWGRGVERGEMPWEDDKKVAVWQHMANWIDKSLVRCITKIAIFGTQRPHHRQRALVCTAGFIVSRLQPYIMFIWYTSYRYMHVIQCTHEYVFFLRFVYFYCSLPEAMILYYNDMTRCTL